MITTLAATLHITIRDRTNGPPLADVQATVPAGRTTVAVPVIHGTRVEDVRVDASDAEDRVATADMALVPGTELVPAAIRSLNGIVDYTEEDGFSSHTTSHCRPASRRTVTCRWTFYGDDAADDSRGTSRITLRRDGLIGYDLLEDHHPGVDRQILEPMR